MITLTREEAQQMLDALIDAADSQNWEMQQNIDQHGEWYRRSIYLKQAVAKSQETIETLRARLAQDDTAREDGFIPVHGYWGEHFVEIQHPTKLNEIVRFNFDTQPEPKPVAWIFVNKFDGGEYIFKHSGEGVFNKDEFDIKPLYTAPPQREWQGLTDEDIGEVLEQVGGFNMNRHMFARAIEAKLKEKNHG